jgi:alkylresorcinol/alkylpyrone synthase
MASPPPPGWPRPSLATNWLFVTIETCSIAIRLDSDDPAAIVATAIFGDGAAAAVVFN